MLSIRAKSLLVEQQYTEKKSKLSYGYKKKKYNIYIEKEKRKNLLQVSFEKTSRWQYIIPRGNQSSGSIRRLFIFKKGKIERLVWGRERKGGRGGRR